MRRLPAGFDETSEALPRADLLRAARRQLLGELATLGVGGLDAGNHDLDPAILIPAPAVGPARAAAAEARVAARHAAAAAEQVGEDVVDVEVAAPELDRAGAEAPALRPAAEGAREAVVVEALRHAVGADRSVPHAVVLLALLRVTEH